ncbi:MAG: hypothetical protein HQ488_04200 [Parcubacteria group bacterium]|nr:hypothetical protein [Parcubacteria group bacterium]
MGLRALHACVDAARLAMFETNLAQFVSCTPRGLVGYEPPEFPVSAFVEQRCVRADQSFMKDDPRMHHPRGPVVSHCINPLLFFCEWQVGEVTVAIC